VMEEREPASIAAGISYAMFSKDVAEYFVSMFMWSECDVMIDELLCWCLLADGQQVKKAVAVHVVATR
jgi:hypothetical protein